MLEGRLLCINSRRCSRSELNIASVRQHHVLIKDNSPLSKIISILTRLINECLHFKMFSSGLILSGHECLCATSQKRHPTRVILFAVNNLQTVTFPLGSMGKTITSYKNHGYSTLPLMCGGSPSHYMELGNSTYFK